MTTAMLSEATVTLQSAGESNGAAWGGWKPRAARRSDGSYVFVTMAGNPAYQAGGSPGVGPNSGDPWWQYTHLWQVWIYTPSTNGWAQLQNPNATQAICGREPPCLLLGAGDEVLILGWPPLGMVDPKSGGAHPVLFRQSTGFAPEPLPGDWSVVPVPNEHWPYSGAAIDAAGQVVVVQCIAAGVAPTPNAPGAFRYAAATPVAGQPVTWTAGSVPSSDVPLRGTVAYPMPYPGGMDLVYTIDTLREEQGFPAAPGGGWDYLENEADVLRITPLVGPSITRTTVRRETPAGSTIPEFYIFDAYRDPAGLLHLLAAWNGDDLPSGRQYSAGHAIIDQRGALRSLTEIPLPYANLGRIAQDAGGRFYFLSLNQGVLSILAGQDGDTDGTRLGPVQQMKLAGSYPAGSQYSLYCAPSGQPAGRSGSRGLSNELLLLWDLDNFRWYSALVQLSTAAPMPAPTPVPTPVDPGAALASRVAALETQVAQLEAAITAVRNALAS